LTLSIRPPRRAASGTLSGPCDHPPTTDDLAELLCRDAELRALQDPRLQRPPA
jgi:hypothetical protein